jgi:hypothetical protein
MPPARKTTSRPPLRRTDAPALRRGRVLRLAGLAFACAVAMPAPATAAPFLRGVADNLYRSRDADTRQHWLDETVRAQANLVRVTVDWRSHARSRPADPTDPLDPAYGEFEEIDAAVREASERGLEPSFLVTRAPNWAEGKRKPGDATEGSWKPDPAAFEAFATALARRYSGGFVGPEGPVPRVRYYQAWGEPNLSEHLTPQWTGSRNSPRPFAALRYRELLNALYAGVKSVDPDATVIAGGTGPFGDRRFRRRTRPLRFLREVLCLRHRKRLKAKECPDPPRFDILSHHPINIAAGGPGRSAIHPDDVIVADFRKVVRTMRAAEKRRTVPRGRHPVWATELIWETKPPDRRFGVPLNRQARWLEESFFSLWKQGAEAVVWAQIVDEEIQEDGFSGHQGGLFTDGGKAKPGFVAFRFPFVAERSSKKKKKKLAVWTIPPSSGELAIEHRRGSSWRTIRTAAVTAGEPLQLRLRLAGKVRLRGAVNGEQSLPYRLRR